MIEPVYIKTQKRIQRTGTYIDHGVTVGIQLIIDEKGEQQVLDMELIKVGNLSLFAPPGSYSFSPLLVCVSAACLSQAPQCPHLCVCQPLFPPAVAIQDLCVASSSEPAWVSGCTCSVRAFPVFVHLGLCFGMAYT